MDYPHDSSASLHITLYITHDCLHSTNDPWNLTSHNVYTNTFPHITMWEKNRLEWTSYDNTKTRTTVERPAYQHPLYDPRWRTDTKLGIAQWRLHTLMMSSWKRILGFISSRYIDLEPLSKLSCNMCSLVLSKARLAIYICMLSALTYKSTLVAMSINWSKYVSISSWTWFFSLPSVSVLIDEVP